MPNKWFKSFASLSGTGRAGPLTKRYVHSMTKTAKLLLLLPTLYVVGFFAWAPIYLLAHNPYLSWLANFTYETKKLAIDPLLQWSGENGTVFKINSKNVVFWCNQFKSCHVQ